MAKKHPWKPLQRANLVRNLTEADITDAMRHTGQDYEATRQALEEEVFGCEYWVNDLYQVAKRQLWGTDEATGERKPAPMVHLNIRRRDGKVIFRDWRHFQWIKNQLVGDECEAVEMYPAESRLNDTCNKYHLFAWTDPTYRLPFGMQERDVVEEDSTRIPGHRQRRIIPMGNK